MPAPPRRRPAPASEDLSPAGPYRALKQAGLALLCLGWVLIGAIGHDPWKTDDATAFGIAWEMLRTGDFLVPALGGEPYATRPPLVYALAAVFGRVFSGVLPVHDGARLAASALLGATLLLLTAAGIEFNGRRTRWLPALLFIGCVGLWDRGHLLSPELGLLAGIAGALYGIALAQRRPVAGGAVIGGAAAFAFLAHGFAGPLWIAVTLCLLPVASGRYRHRDYARTVAVAAALGIAFAAAWPVALSFVAPGHLAAWWAAQLPGGIASLFSDPLFLAKNLPWFAWPVLPLALWTLWTRGRGFNGGLNTPAVVAPGVLAAVIAVALVAGPEPRGALALPLLVPLALIAALEIDTLKRGFSAALDWFGILTFGLLAALLWWLWVDAWLHGMAPAVARLFRDTEVGYRPPVGIAALAISAFLTLLWLALVRPARRSNRRAALNWAAGMTLLWGLYMTIWLPYLDSRRSYRSVAQALAAQLPATGCVASRRLGEPQRALFDYFAGLRTVREELRPDHGCPMLLVQHGRTVGANAPAQGWTAAWTGRLQGDDTELYVLYTRTAP